MAFNQFVVSTLVILYTISTNVERKDRIMGLPNELHKKN